MQLLRVRTLPLAPGLEPDAAADPLPLHQRLARHTATWSPASRGLLWMAASGLIFSVLNTGMRSLALQLDPMQTQFVRYATALVMLLPVVLWSGWRNYRPQNIGGQFTRGALHTMGLVLWFLSLPHITLPAVTAIGFSAPIFMMIGARIFFKEAMHWDRWLATLLGFAGVLVVVGPKLGGGGGWWYLVMLASAPVFAASFLLTKVLTRNESAGVILFWQALSVSLFSLPMGLLTWQPLSAGQWAAFVACGALGNAGHYCLTRAFAAADVSATQSVKFLDLLWASVLGLLVFGDVPTQSTLLGGAVIAAATLWVARRESRRGRPTQVAPVEDPHA